MRARGVWEKQSCRSALVIRNSGNRFFPLPSDRFTLEDGGGSIGGGGRDGIRNASKNDLSGIPSAEGRRSRAVSGVSSRSIAVLFPPYIVGRLRVPPSPSYVVANHRHADQMPTILLSPVPFMDIATPLPH